MFIFFGTGRNYLKTITVAATCPRCLTTGPHTVGLYGSYAHICWIPTFPLSKQGVVVCGHCMATYDNHNAPPALRKQLSGHLNALHAPTPGYYWLGSGLLVTLLLFCVGLVFLNPANKPGETDGGQFGEFKRRRATESRTRTGTASRLTTGHHASDYVPAAPDAARRVLAEDPQVGDTYVFNTPNQRPRITSLFSVLSVSGGSVEVQWSVYQQNTVSGRDELLSGRKHVFARADLVNLEKSGTIRSIRRK